MTSAIFSPQARRDVLEATRWIARDNKVAAKALRDSVKEGATRIGRHPLSGTAKPDLADAPVRFLTLSGFPYILVYDAESNPPVILRILHGARDLPDLMNDL